MRWPGRFPVFRGNVKVLSIVSLLTGVYFSMIHVVWQPFILSLGASMAMLGLIQTIGGLGGGGVMGTLLQPLGGRLSDRRGRKTFIVFGSFLYITALTFFTLASYLHDLRLLIPAFVAAGFATLRVPAVDSLIAESVETHERGMAYSLVAFFRSFPGLVTSVIGGFIADTLGYVLVFLIGVILEGVNFNLLLRLLREAPTPHQAGKLGLRGSLRVFFVSAGKLKAFYAAMAMDSFWWGIGGLIFFGLLRKTYNFSNFQLGALLSVRSVSMCAFQVPTGKLVEKYGCRKTMILSEGLTFLVTTGWLLATRFEVFILLEVVFGSAVAFWMPAVNTYLADSVSREGRAEAMGKLAFYRGVVGFPSPYIGGFLYDALGYLAPISITTFGMLLNFFFMVLAIKEPSRDRHN